MRRFFEYAVSAAVCVMTALTSCQKNVVDEQSSAEMVTLEVSVPVAETKVVSGIDESKINGCQVFVFNDSDVREAYVNGSSSKVDVNCTLGSKTVAVLVNAPVINDVTVLDDLMTKRSSLSDNAADALVMEGMCPLEIESTENVKVEVHVTRKVAKVKLVEVATAFDIEQYRNAPFSISSVYLINVPADNSYFTGSVPQVWFNKSGYDAADDNTLIYDEVSDPMVEPSAMYFAENTFFCYPTTVENDSFDEQWSPRNTRLVVEAVLGDQTYYYPVTLPKLEQNKSYEVSLTITRPGSYVPDAIVDKFAAEFTVVVEDWVSGGSVSEEI